jgi:hypothetical protein
MISILPEGKPGADFIELGFFQYGSVYILFLGLMVEDLPQRIDDHAVSTVV